MGVDPKTLAVNFYLIIGAVVAGVIVLVIVVALWTSMSAGLFLARQKRSQAAYEASRTGPDGQPLPPRARGLCEGCQTVQDEVYHTPAGRRLCRACYWQSLANPT